MILPEAIERFVDGKQLLGVRLNRPVGVVQCRTGTVPASLERPALASVVDDDLTHGARRDPEEVAAVFDGSSTLIDELQVGFMDERRGIENRAVGPAAPQGTAGEPPELWIDEMEQGVDRIRRSPARGLQNPRDLLLG